MLAILIFVFSCMILTLLIILCETYAMRYPHTKFTKWWRKYVVENDLYDKY